MSERMRWQLTVAGWQVESAGMFSDIRALFIFHYYYFLWLGSAPLRFISAFQKLCRQLNFARRTL